jgi:hypothetical protein
VRMLVQEAEEIDVGQARGAEADFRPHDFANSANAYAIFSDDGRTIRLTTSPSRMNTCVSQRLIRKERPRVFLAVPDRDVLDVRILGQHRVLERLNRLAMRALARAKLQEHRAIHAVDFFAFWLDHLLSPAKSWGATGMPPFLIGPELAPIHGMDKPSYLNFGGSAYQGGPTWTTVPIPRNTVSARAIKACSSACYKYPAPAREGAAGVRSPGSESSATVGISRRPPRVIGTAGPAHLAGGEAHRPSRQPLRPWGKSAHSLSGSSQPEEEDPTLELWGTRAGSTIECRVSRRTAACASLNCP